MAKLSSPKLLSILRLGPAKGRQLLGTKNHLRLTTHRFGFAKYFSLRDAENCIRGLYNLGYEVGFARVS